MDYDKPIIFLISHENSRTGSPIALLNVKNYLDRFHIKNIYLNKTDNIDIVSLISKYTNSITICNSLLNHDLLKKLIGIQNTKCYWYIHEWLDDLTYDTTLNIFNNFSVNEKESINYIFICNKSLENYKRYFAFIKKTQIVFNSYNISSIEQKRLENIEFKKNNNIILSMIGYISITKNQQSFVDNIFYRLKDKYSNIKLLLVGEEKRKLNVKEEYKDSIIIKGIVDNAIPYINLSDIIISYSIREVMPLNILEAFYCGKPVVSTDVGGLSEIIENGKNGFLAKDSFYDTICRLIEDENLRIQIGKEARKTFLEKCNDFIQYKPFLEIAKTIDDYKYVNNDWYVTIKKGNGDFQSIIPPKDSYYADPFFIIFNNEAHLFFEEYDKKREKGHISYCKIEYKDDVLLKNPIVKVLDEDFHLSYPFLIEENNKLYMIPESFQANSIYLYECIEMPNKWKIIRTLVSNINAVDSTVFKYDNIYWLFTSEKYDKNKNRGLRIFYSDNLFNENWIAHPINSQNLNSELKHLSGRGAGYIYEENSNYYRPVQENVRFYGESIRINKIIKLTKLEFIEEFETIITSPFKCGTHHINKIDDYIVMDINAEARL